MKNATSSDRASNAIRAYTNGIMKGKIEADGWMSIVGAAPSIIDDIAAATGRSSAEIREMGAAAKLTAQMLNEGLRKSLDSNKAAADGMATTVKDAFTNMRTNLAAFVGEANRANGATGVLSSAIVSFGNNIDTASKLLMAAGAGALAKYIAQLGASALTSGRAMLAARAHATEELNLARANEIAAASALKQAQAAGGLTAAQGRAAAAANAHAAALQRVAAASSALSTVGGTLLRIMGGPAGLIFAVASVASSMWLFSSSTDQAYRSVLSLNQPLDEVIKKFKELTESQRQLALQSANLDIGYGVKQLDAAMKDFTLGTVVDGAEAMAGWQGASSAAIRELVSAAKSGAISYQELDSKLIDLIKSYAESDGRSQVWINHQISLASEVSAGAKIMIDARNRVNELTKANNDVAEAARNAAAGQREFNGALNDSQTDDYLKKLRDRANALRDGNSATKAAQRYLSDLKDVSDERKGAILAEAAAVDKLNESQKAHKTGESEGTKAANERKAAEKENIKTLDELATALVQAGLSGEELAATKAKASLNKFATPEEIQNVEALAKAIQQVEQAKTNKALLGQMDPVASEQMKFQTEIENLKKLNKAKLLEDQRYLELKTQAETAHDEQMRVLQEENFRRQSGWNDMLIGTLDNLQAAGTNALTGLITGASNGTDAIRALGQAILQDAIGSLVKMGVQYVKNLIMGKAAEAASTAVGIAAAGTLATAWAPAAALASLASFGANAAPAMAGIASTVALSEGLAMVGGGRQYGGPVAPGAMHRINETGKPEILNTASGKQYLLPNTRGQVVSNKDATSGSVESAPRVTVNLIEDASRGGQIEQTQGDQGQIIDAFVADIRGGGKASRALESTYGMRRQGR